MLLVRPFLGHRLFMTFPQCFEEMTDVSKDAWRKILHINMLLLCPGSHVGVVDARIARLQLLVLMHVG